MASEIQFTAAPKVGHLPPPDPRRRRVEQRVLGCQLAGAKPDEDIGPLLRDPLHIRIQAAIDAVRAEQVVAHPHVVVYRLLRDGAGDETDHTAYLHELEGHFEGRNDLDSALDENLDLLESVARVEDNLPIDLVAFEDIADEAVDWVWDGWLARGKLQLLAGPVGVGKTTLALSLAATITSGGTLPDGSRAAASDVLLWSGEDDAADSLAPRFRACGGDPARLFLINGKHERNAVKTFDPARDSVALATALLARRDPALLIIDPIVSAVAGDTDKNAATRHALAPLVALADACHVAVLGISHFGKTGQGRDPVNRVLGSLAFVAMARLVHVTAKLANGTNLLLRAKSNIGPIGGGFAYTLEQVETATGIRTQRIAWGEAVEGTARELLKEGEPPAEVDTPQRDAARAWLADVLEAESLAVLEIKQRAATDGHAWRTIQRAKQSLAVEAVQAKDGWHWRLPRAPGENTVALWRSDQESMG